MNADNLEFNTADFVKTAANYSLNYPQHAKKVAAALELSRYLSHYDGIIAGGFLMKLYRGMDLGNSDLDIFFTDTEAMRNFTARLRTPDFIFHNETSAASTFLTGIGLKIQVIKRIWGDSKKQIVGSFDLAPCKIYSFENDIYIHPRAAKCYSDMCLRDGQRWNPYINIERVNKYIALGFKPKGTLVQKLHEYQLIAMDEMVTSPPVIMEGPRRAMVIGADELHEPEPVRARRDNRANLENFRYGPLNWAEPIRQPARPALDLGGAIDPPDDGYSYHKIQDTYLPKYDLWLDSLRRAKYITNDVKDFNTGSTISKYAINRHYIKNAAAALINRR